MNSELEEKVEKEAIRLLKNGKPDWDIPHTLDAVDWIRKLTAKEGGNEKILVTAIYLHDTGYPPLESGYDFNDLIKSKNAHAEIAAKNAELFLEKIDDFSKEERIEIVRLIENHDKHDNVKDLNRQLIMEADGLAAINWYKVTPNFDKKNCLKFLEYFKKEKGIHYKTKTGKKFLEALLIKAEEYWK